MPTILHFIPTLEGGGSERQLATLACAQAALGDEVHIGLRRRGAFAASVEAAGVRLHLLGDLRGPHPRLVAAMRRLVRRLQPEVVQTWLPQADVCGGLAALSLGIPWVMTEREANQGPLPRDAVSRLRRWLARGASAVVANSRAGAEHWRHLDAPGRPVLHVANGVDAVAVRHAMRDASTLAEQGPVVLLVGRLIASKGHDVALRAFAALDAPRARLRIFGDGPERNALERLVAELGIGPRVEWLPFSLDWWRALATADLLVSLSRAEGAPNVVLEAMASGVPLLVSDIPEHRELLDDSTASFVPLDDALAAAEAMARILREPTAASELAGHARLRVHRMTVPDMAKAYSAIYATLRRPPR